MTPRRITAAIWSVFALVGLVYVGWFLLGSFTGRLVTNEEVQAACWFSVPGLLFAIRDSVRDWKQGGP